MTIFMLGKVLDFLMQYIHCTTYNNIYNVYSTCMLHIAIYHIVLLFYVVVCQTHHSTSVTPQHQASLRDIYHQLLSRILGWLTPDDIYRLCDVSPEAQLAGFCNQANFNGIDLFHYFEQRKLITPTSLSYLRGYLKVIGRVDMCGLIDNYMDTYLNRSSLSHGKPLTEPHPPSHEIHLSSCGELHPPPFNPEYCDPSELLCMYYSTLIN